MGFGAVRRSLVIGVVLALTLALVVGVYAYSRTSKPRPSSSACVIDGTYHLPSPEWTPGKLCTKDDPDFDGLRYPEQIPHCRRHVTEEKKRRVAERYGVNPAELSHYEVDHLIELNAGGSNDEENLWPQPLGPEDAAAKDHVEDETFHGLERGTMTQAEAVAEIKAWRPAACP